MSPIQKTYLILSIQAVVVLIWTWVVRSQQRWMLVGLLLWAPLMLAAIALSKRSIADSDKSYVSMLAVSTGVFCVWLYLATAIPWG